MTEGPVEMTEPALGTPPLRARRALLIVVMYFVIQVAAGAVVGLVFGIYIATYDRSRPSSAARTAASLAVVPATVVGAILGGTLALRMTKRSFRGSAPHEFYRTVGWSPASRFQVLLAALMGVTLSAGYLLVASLVFPPGPDRLWGPFAAAVENGGWPRHTWAALALLLAPPVEEFVFRGVLFAGLVRSWRLPAAAVGTTILFVVAHVTSLQPYWPALLAITLVAVAALHARVVTKSLTPCIAMHAAYNLGLVVAVYASA